MVWENKLGDQLFHENMNNIAPTGIIQYYNLVIKEARGAAVTDVAGKQYIDLLGSASAANIGHNHPHLTEALKPKSINSLATTLATSPILLASH